MDITVQTTPKGNDMERASYSKNDLMVFQCKFCRNIVGDSLAYVCQQKELGLVAVHGIAI